MHSLFSGKAECVHFLTAKGSVRSSASLVLTAGAAYSTNERSSTTGEDDENRQWRPPNVAPHIARSWATTSRRTEARPSRARARVHQRRRVGHFDVLEGGRTGAVMAGGVGEVRGSKKGSQRRPSAQDDGATFSRTINREKHPFSELLRDTAQSCPPASCQRSRARHETKRLVGEQNGLVGNVQPLSTRRQAESAGRLGKTALEILHGDL
jgi:hypothetical protein